MAGVNFDDVWKVVTDPEFVNNEPENEYDIKVIMRTYKLMKEGVEVLNGPIPLSSEQRMNCLHKSNMQIEFPNTCTCFHQKFLDV